jgi:ketosteroid isomerase-like protein
MSEENVEIVRQAWEANRSGAPGEAVEKAIALAHPDLEFISRLTAVEGGSYRGAEGIRRYFQDMEDAWQEWHNELHEVTEIGRDTVLTDGTFRGTAQSGVEAELRSGIVWKLSGGKVIGMHAYPSREEALEAAGLSE